MSGSPTTFGPTQSGFGPLAGSYGSGFGSTATGYMNSPSLFAPASPSQFRFYR